VRARHWQARKQTLLFIARQAKAWSRFFCHSVYVTMYLNDHARASFYESLGLNTTQFNRCGVAPTLETLNAATSAQLLPSWFSCWSLLLTAGAVLWAGAVPCCHVLACRLRLASCKSDSTCYRMQACHHRDQQHHRAHLPLGARLRDARILVRSADGWLDLLCCCQLAS
jgi:hypothetical protein